MFIGLLAGVGTAAYIVMLPWQEEMVADWPPGRAALFSLALLVVLLAGAFFFPRITGMWSTFSGFGSVASAIGSLFSDHVIYSPIFLLWAVLFWVAQHLSHATLEAIVERSMGLR